MPVTPTYTTDFGLSTTGYGQKTLFGTVLPPGGQVAAFVRSTGAQSGDDSFLASSGMLVTTLAAGLARVRSGLGDTVYVLPGHVENVVDGTTMLTNLVAGTRIIGVGSGALQPTFTFTATTSQWAVSVANVFITGCKFALTGAVIVKAFYITGADFTFSDNLINMGTGAANLAVIGMEFDTGAARFQVSGNKFYGTLAAATTDGILVTAALSDWEIKGNRMIFAGTATAKGLIHVVGASLNAYIGYNTVYNTVASSTTCIAFDNAASDGICEKNMMGCTVGTATAPNVSGIVLAGTSTLWRFLENYSTPTKNTSGDISPVRDT